MLKRTVSLTQFLWVPTLVEKKEKIIFHYILLCGGHYLLSTLKRGCFLLPLSLFSVLQRNNNFNILVCQSTLANCCQCKLSEFCKRQDAFYCRCIFSVYITFKNAHAILCQPVSWSSFCAVRFILTKSSNWKRKIYISKYHRFRYAIFLA